MSRLDGLWVGLKLLGIYFVIIGLADLLPFASSTLTIRAGVYTIAGIGLLATADYFAPLDRRRDSPIRPEEESTHR
jgi:hypothetical protein